MIYDATLDFVELWTVFYEYCSLQGRSSNTVNELKFTAVKFRGLPIFLYFTHLGNSFSEHLSEGIF